MELVMLGTGAALVTKCYNTCFALKDDAGCVLVDAGGGNGIFGQMDAAGLDWKAMRHIIVTHKHTDHILGVLWMMRFICEAMSENAYEGEAFIYSHAEATGILERAARSLFSERIASFIGTRLHLVTVEDLETKNIAGRDYTFFDIHSTKARQFGFFTHLDDGGKFSCCGDEPCAKECRHLVEKSAWLLHEAYCLEGEAAIFHPREIHHSTVKDACITAEELGVRNLVLYHTVDKDIKDRKRLYLKEGGKYFTGRLFVPDDLERIELGPR